MWIRNVPRTTIKYVKHVKFSKIILVLILECRDEKHRFIERTEIELPYFDPLHLKVKSQKY